jgi:hypothetical protein
MQAESPSLSASKTFDPGMLGKEFADTLREG